MTAQKRGISGTFVQLLTGGLLGSLLTTYMVGQWDYQREQRGALHTFVVSWHGTYLGGHRDNISEWLLTPDGVILRAKSPADFGPALIEAFETNRAPATAILAIADFYRSIEICIVDNRCDSKRTHAAFGPSARDFHGLFGPLLRNLDCEKDYPGTEAPVLLIAYARQNLLSGPERCEEMAIR